MKSRKFRFAAVLCAAALMLAGCGKKQPRTLEDIDKLSEDELESALMEAAGESDKKSETSLNNAETSEEAAATQAQEEVYVLPDPKSEILDAKLEDGIIQLDDMIVNVNIDYKHLNNHSADIIEYFNGTTRDYYEKLKSLGLVSLLEVDGKLDLEASLLSKNEKNLDFCYPKNAYMGSEIITVRAYNDSDDLKKFGDCKAAIYVHGGFKEYAYFAKGINCVDGTWNYSKVKQLLDEGGYEYNESQAGNDIKIHVDFKEVAISSGDNKATLNYWFTFDASSLLLTKMSTEVR